MHIGEVPLGRFGFVKKKSLDFFLKYKLLGLVFAALLIFCFVLLGRWMGGPHLSPSDFWVAKEVYLKWERGEKSLDELEEFFKNRPQLKANYESRILQKLLSTAEGGLSESYIGASKKRLEGAASYYKEFSTASLLIRQGEYEKGLKEAIALKEMMKNDVDFWRGRSREAPYGTLLYGYNLLRIAILYQKLGDLENERLSWKEFKQESGSVDQEGSLRYHQEAYALLEKNFQIRKVSLRSYIEAREKALEKG